MKLITRKRTTLFAITVALGAAGCSAASNTGVTGTALASHPDVPGTVFTIVFENENADAIITPSNPFFYKLAQQNAQAAAYISTTHPSAPNYIMMTSGATNGVANDNDPNFNVQVPGTENLADQLDAAGVPWRAYMESMGEPCTKSSSGNYSAHHDPFLYYATMATNSARCNEHVVDFDANFTNDLATGAYRYMWITPNMCNDIHNCSTQVGDAWLQKTITQIQASAAYQNGGAIFVLFDEGSTRVFGASADLATIITSPNLRSTGFVSQTAFDHRSYLATIEDIFAMPRLSTTVNATSMDEFFKTDQVIKP